MSMILPISDLEEKYLNAENDLMSNCVQHAFNRTNFESFPNYPGVYALFFNNELVYIGETADIKKRMKDLKKTYNHTFRRKLGFHFFEDAKIEGQKFSDIIENRLNLIFNNYITVSFIEVNFGRTEIENYLIQSYKEKCSLFKSNSKRGN